MGNQESEMTAQYKGAPMQPGVDFPSTFNPNPQSTSLQDHHSNMPAPVRVSVFKMWKKVKPKKLKMKNYELQIFY